MELFLNVGPRMCMQMSKPFIITALKKPGHKIDTLITNHIIEDMNRGISCLCYDFHIQLVLIPLWSVTAEIQKHLNHILSLRLHVHFCNLICKILKRYEIVLIKNPLLYCLKPSFMWPLGIQSFSKESVLWLESYMRYQPTCISYGA